MISFLQNIKNEIIFSLKPLEIENLEELLEFSRPENSDFGDLSINLALKTAKILKDNPRKIASKIINLVSENDKFMKLFKKVDIAGPGFINFFFSDTLLSMIVTRILELGAKFGENNVLSNKKVLIEFVSANPTGPLTIAHARQAAVGDSLHKILSLCSATVHKEYYLNDKGVQISILGQSVFLRYKEVLGEKIDLPDNFYQGEYVKDIATSMVEKYGNEYLNKSIEEGGEIFREESYKIILDIIREDLNEFLVDFDSYFSEKTLEEENKIEECIQILKDKCYLFKEDDALWFKTTKFGDDKDRVLKKSNGDYTYLTSDIPYHLNKLKRGYNSLINILGPDHHGYIMRLKASVEALGYDPQILKVLIIQLTTLYRGNEQLRMSTRKGEFITLRELIDEVGVDAARYFFVSRKTDTHLDFDLELAKKHTPDNPVFYVQYACARINSILLKAKENNIEIVDNEFDISIIGDFEKSLIKSLFGFTEVIIDAAKNLEPQKITNYLEDLASKFQKYYSSGNKVITDNKRLTLQKLLILNSVKQVLTNGLSILGISVPDRM